jgi:plasmid stabilization system protein ParE
MRVRWTSKAQSDLVRLRDFLATKDAAAASRVVRSLVAAPNVRLLLLSLQQGSGGGAHGLDAGAQAGLG